MSKTSHLLVYFYFSLSLLASGQAEGHSYQSSTIQKPHIQLWNYADTSFVMTIGVDIFETSLKTLAISADHEGKTYLAAIDSNQPPNLRVWRGNFGDGEIRDEYDIPELIGETKAHR